MIKNRYKKSIKEKKTARTIYLKPPDTHFFFLVCQTNSVETTMSMIKKNRYKKGIKEKKSQEQYRSIYSDSDHLKCQIYILYSRACLD